MVEKDTATLNRVHATLTGRSRVNAAVFGGGRHTWRLQLYFQTLVRDKIRPMSVGSGVSSGVGSGAGSAPKKAKKQLLSIRPPNNTTFSPLYIIYIG